MTQYLVEEAIWERLERVEARAHAMALGSTFDDTPMEGGGSVDSLFSPGEQQQQDHASRMARLGVG